MRIITSCRGLKAFLGGFILTLLIVAAGTSAARAQVDSNRIDCAKLGVGVKSLGDCCFTFTLENGLSDRHIIGADLNIVGSGRYASSVVALGKVNAVATNTGVAWRPLQSVTLPARTEGLKVCFSTSPNSQPTNPFYAVVNWLDSVNGDVRVVCSDTIKLECDDAPKGDSCFTLLEQSISCVRPNQGTKTWRYEWCFNVKNLSGFAANRITIGDQTVNFQPALASGATCSRICITVNGVPGTTLNLSGLLCSRDSVITWKEGDSVFTETIRGNCCEHAVRRELPRCETPNDCFEVIGQEVSCKPGQQGALGYVACLNIRNLSNFTMQTVTVNNAMYQFNSLVPPGGTGIACIPLSGTPGTTVSLGMLLCGETRDTVIRDTVNDNRDTVVDSKQCCDGKVDIKLPYCDSIPSKGCMEFVEQRIECDSTGGYLWCFNIRNQSNFPAQYLYLVPNNQNVTIAPGVLSLNPAVQPGGLSTRYCVQIIGASPGELPVIVRMCDKSYELCCLDSATLKLPECEPHSGDCCSDFRLALNRTTNAASATGYATIRTLLSAGPRPLTKISATLVSASVNGQPVYGYFNNGIIFNPFGPGTIVPAPYGREIIWSSPTPISMNAPISTNTWLWMKFPEMAPNRLRDTLEYCIRMRFTDDRCMTCDTLICIKRIRYRFIFGGGQSSFGADTKGGAHTAGGNQPNISGVLTNGGSGTMNITFPNPPSELGTVKYVGMIIQPMDGVQLTSVTADASGYNFTQAYGFAVGSFIANPGDNVTLNMNYANLGERKSLDHFVTFLYTSSTNPGDTLDEPGVVTLRKGDLQGGDMLTPQLSTSLEKVRTFALHLTNANGSQEPIDHLVIKTVEGVQLVAVGPTSSNRQAVLKFGATADNNSGGFVSESLGQGVEIVAGESHSPIYLTLAGGDIEGDAAIDFATVNQHGQTISEGQIYLVNPISGVKNLEGGATGAQMLQQSFPNPATHSATIQFDLPRTEANVSLVITDAAGKEVANLIRNEALTGGPHAVYVNTSGLPSGTYFYTLKTGNHVETLSMQIQK